MQGPLIFGEVLFDCFPDGSRVLGGAPFNVAWHLQALGMAPCFVSRIGRDPQGVRIREAMNAWGLETAALQEDDSRPTGKVEVRFEQGEPHYEIVTGSAWDRIDPDLLPGATPALLYHGTLAARSTASAAALNRLRRRGAPIFLDVNLRSPWWTGTQVRELMQGARWIKLNRDELAQLSANPQTVEENARQMLRDCPAAELLLVTAGEEGAMGLTRSDDPLRVAPLANLPLVDTVGAGDAFAAVAILGLLRGWPLQRVLERAQQFAGALVGVRGATVADPAFYRTFLDDWSRL